jgi:tetratricopeptide (TPR) repeat protein
LVNASTRYIDTLQLDQAHGLLQRATALLDNQIDLEVSLNNNWGEYWLTRGEYDRAEAAFARVLEVAETYRRDVYLSARAGFGLSILAVGRLREASAIADELGMDPLRYEIINFDPSLIVRLHCRLYELNRCPGKALALYVQVRGRLRDRFAMAWLKLGLAEARWRRQHSPQTVRPCVSEGQSVATDLGLSQVAEAFNRLQ